MSFNKYLLTIMLVLIFLDFLVLVFGSRNFFIHQKAQIESLCEIYAKSPKNCKHDMEFIR